MAKIGMKSLLVAALAVCASGGTAHAVSCVKLNQLWQDQYYYDIKADWPLETFTCTTTASVIAEAMYDLSTTTFKPNADGYTPNFYDFTVNLIKKTEFVEKDEKRPWAIAQAGNAGVMTIFKHFEESSRVWRAASLLHEARHIQPTDPSHVNCLVGEGKGMPRCDDRLRDDGTWEQGSGYNYTFHYLWWVRDASKQTELDTAMAGAHLKNMITRNFNNVTPAQVKKWAD